MDQREGIAGCAPLAWSMAYGALGSALAALAAGRAWHIEWSLPFAASLAYLTIAGSIATFGAFFTLAQAPPRRAGP